MLRDLFIIITKISLYDWRKDFKYFLIIKIKLGAKKMTQQLRASASALNWYGYFSQHCECPDTKYNKGKINKEIVLTELAIKVIFTC